MNHFSTADGLYNPAHMFLMLIVLSSVGFVVAVLLLISKIVAGKPKPATNPADADLDRRLRSLELERMELEIFERRQRMMQAQPSATSKAA